MDDETITQQLDLLTQNRRRLAVLFQQQTRLGDYAPPHVRLEIEDIQAAIRDIKAQLRASGAVVDDHPDDARLVQVTPSVQPTRHQLRAPVGDFVGRERETAKPSR